MRISDWSSDVCSSDLLDLRKLKAAGPIQRFLGTHHRLVEIGRRVQDVRRKIVGVLCEVARRAAHSLVCPSPRSPQEIRNRAAVRFGRSEEHTSELQSLMRISYAVFCLKKKKHSIESIQNVKTYDGMTTIND